jgi:methylamine dehydrogenase heavy chain
VQASSIRRWLVSVAWAMGLTLGGVAHAAQPVEFATGELVARSLPEKRPEQRWVWVHDFRNGLYSRARLLDVDTGEILGHLDTGWEGIKIDMPPGGDVMYHAPMYMSRGYRGERTDVVEYVNKRTLQVEKEVQIPAKAIRGWPDPNHTALSDDARFMLLQFFTPASSVGIVDLKAGKFVGEVETTGCAHVMAAGNNRFFTLCGDGSVLLVTLNAEGREVSRKRYPDFFDVERDPLHGSGMRAGNTWYFTSWNAVIHPLDVSGDDLQPLERWSAGARIGGRDWVTGTIEQPLWLHEGSKLFISMHPKDATVKGGGTDYHRQPGVEVWVYDLAARKREQRIRLAPKAPAYAIATSPEAKPLLYVASIGSPDLHVYDTRNGKLLKRLRVGQMPTMVQPVK